MSRYKQLKKILMDKTNLGVEIRNSKRQVKSNKFAFGV